MGTVMCCPFSFELRRGSSSLQGTAYVFYDGTVACPPKTSPVFEWLVCHNFRQFTRGCYNQTQTIFEKGFTISLCFNRPRHIDAYDAAQLFAMFLAQDMEPRLCKDDEISKGAVFSSGTWLSATFNGQGVVEVSVPVLSFSRDPKLESPPFEPLETAESSVHPEAVAILPGICKISGILTEMAENVRWHIRGQNPKQVPDTPLSEFQWTSSLSEFADQLFEHLIQQGSHTCTTDGAPKIT
ncbi:hypothetical protein FOFC_21005 [Fusarium oxysporum]|nr:hypothetical protein FOFC_21005 [Fusarium oxysporum]